MQAIIKKTGIQIKVWSPKRRDYYYRNHSLRRGLLTLWTMPVSIDKGVTFGDMVRLLKNVPKLKLKLIDDITGHGLSTRLLEYVNPKYKKEKAHNTGLGKGGKVKALEIYACVDCGRCAPASTKKKETTTSQLPPIYGGDIELSFSAHGISTDKTSLSWALEYDGWEHLVKLPLTIRPMSYVYGFIDEKYNQRDALFSMTFGQFMEGLCSEVAFFSRMHKLSNFKKKILKECSSSRDLVF